jgi:formate dehydrogenase iron-sulfur subunit
VLTDHTKCVGCRLCTSARGCPYGMRAMDGASKAVKCNFCLDRLTATPAETAPYCVKTCPSGARQMVTTDPGGTQLAPQGGAIPRGVRYGTIS